MPLVLTLFVVCMLLYVVYSQTPRGPFGYGPARHTHDVVRHVLGVLALVFFLLYLMIIMSR